MDGLVSRRVQRQRRGYRGGFQSAKAFRLVVVLWSGFRPGSTSRPGSDCCRMYCCVRVSVEFGRAKFRWSAYLRQRYPELAGKCDCKVGFDGHNIGSFLGALLERTKPTRKNERAPDKENYRIGKARKSNANF